MTLDHSRHAPKCSHADCDRDCVATGETRDSVEYSHFCATHRLLTPYEATTIQAKSEAERTKEDHRHGA